LFWEKDEEGRWFPHMKKGGRRQTTTINMLGVSLWVALQQYT